MNDRVTTLPSADYGYGISQEQRNKVLRNTAHKIWEREPASSPT